MKAPTLLLVLAFLAFGAAPAAFAQEIPRPPQGKEQPFPPAKQAPQALQPQAIEKPVEPNKIRATFEIDGAEVPITEGQYYDAYQRLERFDKQQNMRVTVERVYEHLLAFAEAKALGLEATPQEVALYDPLAANAELAKQTQERWQREGTTKEMYDTFQHEARSIQKVKDFFVNNTRLLSNEVFEMYRRDHYNYRLEYVEFPAAGYAEALRATKPTDEEMKKFWDESTMTQNKYRLPQTVTAEVVFFDPAAAGSDAAPAREIPRAEAIAYYQKHKVRLDTQIPSERRKDLYPTSKPDITTLATPFEILKPLIEREILLSGRVTTAFNEAKAPGADLAAIAKKNALGYAKMDKVTRDQAVQQHARFGVQIFPILMNMAPNTLCDDVKMEGQLHFFYRLIDKDQSRLPELKDVKDKILDDYVEFTSLQRAQNAAQAFRGAIDQKVDAEVHAKEEALLAKADEDAAAEAKKNNQTDPKELDRLKNQFRLQAQAKVRQMKDDLAPKFFQQVIADQKLKLLDTGVFELAAPRGERPADPSDPAARANFIKSSYQIRGMEVNQITQVLSDAVTKAHFVARLAEKSEPDYTKMSDSEILAFRSTIERNKSFQAIYRWTYYEVSKRRSLVVK